MKAVTRNRIVEWITALLLLLFVYTGTMKLVELPSFRMVLQTAPMISAHASQIAIAIPVLELMIAVLLFLPRTRFFGMAASALLMAAFSAYVLAMLMLEPKLPCSCGGVLENMSWKAHLLFNLHFTALALWGWWLQAYQYYSTRPRRLTSLFE